MSSETSHNIIVNLENLQNENMKELIKSTNIRLNELFNNHKELEISKPELRTLQHNILTAMNSMIDLEYRNKSTQLELLTDLKESYVKIMMLLEYRNITRDKNTENNISKIKTSINALTAISCSLFVMIIIFLAVVVYCYGEPY